MATIKNTGRRVVKSGNRPKVAVPLSKATRQRVEALFSVEDLRIATEMLVEECGHNLWSGSVRPSDFDRIRFAALKLSFGRLDLLREAVDLGKSDRGDLLLAAGFGGETAHKRWRPMTEKQWLASVDPETMLALFPAWQWRGKLLLFGVACCRSIWHLLSDKRSRKAVEVAELIADGKSSEKRRQRAESAALDAQRDAVAARRASGYRIPEYLTYASKAAYFVISGMELRDGFVAADAILAACSLIAGNRAAHVGSRASRRKKYSDFLRDIFGNPFRPSAIDSRWLTTTTRNLAASIYDDGAFDRLPVLADALEEAGCTDADILAHCRGPGPHVRGCWVVDLVLGKE
jgi:hypothetical protein